MATVMAMVTDMDTVMVILIAMATIIMDIRIDIPIDTLIPIDIPHRLMEEILIMNRGIGPVISDELKGEGRSLRFIETIPLRHKVFTK